MASPSHHLLNNPTWSHAEDIHIKAKFKPTVLFFPCKSNPSFTYTTVFNSCLTTPEVLANKTADMHPNQAEHVVARWFHSAGLLCFKARVLQHKLNSEMNNTDT